MQAARLPDELIEEIFLRLPPDDPACVVRASLASKFWLGLLSGASFLGRYCNLHGAPPMLGFLYSLELVLGRPRFVPTTRFEPRIPNGRWRIRQYAALDCRHGRALLIADDPFPGQLIVWDPMTGRDTKFNKPGKYIMGNTQGAAVLCAAARSGCDHRACHDEGTFLVVFLGIGMSDGRLLAGVCVASSETGEWIVPCASLGLEAEGTVVAMPPVLVEDTLHFMFVYCEAEDLGIINKYDLASNCLSMIDVPVVGHVAVGAITHMAMEDGSLGLAFIDGLSLHLWSRQMGPDRTASWNKLRVVNFDNVLPTHDPVEILLLNGSVKGTNIIFVTTDLGVYGVNLKSLQWKKIWKKEKHFHSVIPYMSFYNPQERARP